MVVAPGTLWEIAEQLQEALESMETLKGDAVAEEGSAEAVEFLNNWKMVAPMGRCF